ncbi:Fic family protein [Nocardia sp. NPDC059180]|uniref:Fic family protein n=1 Tax=Nocardia sp. NPDC059180 TaxID=3346761 RepID=UPI00369E287B
MDTICYRWHHTSDWTPRQLGIAAHAETVRIHPFTDGNVRTTRLLTDIVFVAVQDSSLPQLYDWEIDKRAYIELLREGRRPPRPVHVRNARRGQATWRVGPSVRTKGLDGRQTCAGVRFRRRPHPGTADTVRTQSTVENEPGISFG